MLLLREEWRKVELQLRWMKQMDSGVDHLWEIKEAEYSNVLVALEEIKRMEEG